MCFGEYQSIKNFNCGKEGYSFRPGCLNRRAGERMAQNTEKKAVTHQKE